MTDIHKYQRSEDEESMLGKEQGAKFDQGKNRYDLVAMHALTELAKSYAKLHIPENHRFLPVLYNGALFHARRFWSGETSYLRTPSHNLTLSARYFFELMVEEGEVKESPQLIEAEGYIADERHDLIPPTILDEVVKVYTYGTIKYDDRNWEKGMEWGRLYGALERHASKWRRGEIYDNESGLHHISHAIWQCFSLVEYDYYKIGIDDRAKRPVD